MFFGLTLDVPLIWPEVIYQKKKFFWLAHGDGMRYRDGMSKKVFVKLIWKGP